MADLLKELCRLCNQQNLKAPNYRTIRKRVQALDAKLALQRRHGSKPAAASTSCLVMLPLLGVTLLSSTPNSAATTVAKGRCLYSPSFILPL
jgi:hypothetical protein